MQMAARSFLPTPSWHRWWLSEVVSWCSLAYDHSSSVEQTAGASGVLHTHCSISQWRHCCSPLMGDGINRTICSTLRGPIGDKSCNTASGDRTNSLKTRDTALDKSFASGSSIKELQKANSAVIELPSSVTLNARSYSLGSLLATVVREIDASSTAAVVF